MSERAPPAPRDWVGDRQYPWPATRSLPDGAAVRACFCLVDFQLARTRSDQPFLRLTLTDRHGTVDGRVWENAEAAAAGLRAGSYVGVEGRIEYFNGQPQVYVEQLEELRIQLEDLPLFLPRSARPQDEMEAELQALIASVQEPGLRSLLDACLGPDSETGPGFRLAPAAKYNHHAYLGGLLEHTLSVAAVCAHLAEHYGPEVDRDLLVSAALLHDIGKVREIGARVGFPYTDEGKLLGHILLGLELVSGAARRLGAPEGGPLLLLQHLIAAHQGRYEWQSPREPATLEALILHYADDLDAKLQQVRELMNHAAGPWTAYDRSFRREFLRHVHPPETSAATSSDPAPPAETGPATSSDPAPPPPQSNDQDAGREESPEQRAGEPGVSAERQKVRRPAGGGGAGKRSAHGQRTTGFHRLSEDTLDLFGGGTDT